MRIRLLSTLMMVAASAAAAQTLPSDDPMLRKIWDEGMNRSQTVRLMQTLTDSIGPRLTGTPQMTKGQDWLLATYAQWGVAARKEQYGTWLGWRRGLTHIDLIQPRARALEGTLLAWSGGTPKGRPVEGGTVALPSLPDSAAYAAWYPTVKGKHVLLSAPQPTCRPDSSYRRYALPETFQKMVADRNAANQEWQGRLRRTGLAERDLPARLEAAGAIGVITSLWSQGWGVDKVFNGRTRAIPSVDISCEDYGLLFRLTDNGQSPVLRITADAEFLGEVPSFNVIGEIRGTEKPDQYVLLSAHFDSWDAASGATDNATGTVTMMEAMRILKTVYPAPRRTILVGHWNGEEQGLNGSRAFAEDHPEVVSGLQALWNQDNGTGRVINVSAAGLMKAGGYLADWFARLPSEITRNVNLSFPGAPAGGGSDNAAFICHGAPGFGLGSLDWEYGTYTWHTNRDTFDKVVFDEIRNNATLTAMLTYLAAEEQDQLPRERRVNLVGPGGQPAQWPTCAKALRDFSGYTR